MTTTVTIHAAKTNLSRLIAKACAGEEVPAIIASQDFRILDITLHHAYAAGNLPGPHRDPFDRMLTAQARAEALPVVSADPVFDVYGVRRIWG